MRDLEKVVEIPLQNDYSEIHSIQVASSPDDSKFYLIKKTEPNRSFFQTFSKEGLLLSQKELPETKLIPRKIYEVPEYLNLFIYILSYLDHSPVIKIYLDGDIDFGYKFLSEISKNYNNLFWLSLILLCCFLIWKRGKHYQLPNATIYFWIFSSILFGLPGYLAFLCSREWPAFENCHFCGHPNPVTYKHCLSCHSEAQHPELDGTEILVKTVNS